MSGFTSLNVGVLGLKAAQTALNTTSHNLANVYTPGYVRQTPIFNDYNYIDLNSSVSNKMQVGLGVYVAETNRVRDLLLDAQYRQEAGKQGFYNAQYEAVVEVETFLGETEGTKFQEELNNLWSAINEMAKDGNEVARSELVMGAQSFLDRATSIYSSLISYQETLDTKIKDTVDQINELGNTIFTLNKKISTIEASGIENANDLRDLRDNALDELATLASISYNENANGVVNVKLEGVPFVVDTGVMEMGTAQLDGVDDNSLYLSAVWPFLDNQNVFNLNVEISGNKENDIGTLKGLLLARGDHIANYTNIPKVENYATTSDYNHAVNQYNLTIDASVVMKTQALFDQLINGIVTKMNNILSPTIPKNITVGGVTSLVSVLDVENCSTGEDGELPPEELFTRNNTNRYTEITADDGTTYFVFNETNSLGFESLYTCSNIQMNQTILEDYSKLPFTTSENEVNMKMGEDLLAAWGNTFTNIDPNNLTQKNFKSYYNEFIYEIGNMGSLYQSVSVNYATSANTLDNSRQQITGVSSEEELSNMVKYQSAYNASSRYINAIDEMLEHIITKL